MSTTVPEATSAPVVGSWYVELRRLDDQHADPAMAPTVDAVDVVVPEDVVEQRIGVPAIADELDARALSDGVVVRQRAVEHDRLRRRRRPTRSRPARCSPFRDRYRRPRLGDTSDRCGSRLMLVAPCAAAIASLVSSMVYGPDRVLVAEADRGAVGTRAGRTARGGCASRPWRSRRRFPRRSPRTST